MRPVLSRIIAMAGAFLLLFAGIREMKSLPESEAYKYTKDIGDISLTHSALRDDRQTDIPEEFVTNEEKPEQPSLKDGGVIKIPAINVDVAVLEGMEKEQLLKGVGHAPFSASPGETGNCIIAGHRVTEKMHPFRYLDRLVSGDEIIIKLGGASFTYIVTEAFVVKADEVWVLNAYTQDEANLTLITCHPLGSARKRYIIRAKLEK